MPGLAAIFRQIGDLALRSWRMFRGSFNPHWLQHAYPP